MEIIRCVNVSKSYNPGIAAEVKALKNINLKINSGERVAIIGPSGSGKSTLLHLIGCLDKPTKGKIFIAGKDTSKLTDDELARIRREKIGFVFQFFYLFPTLTALENVMLPMVFTKRNRLERRERAKKLLKLVGLEKRFHHYPLQLSGGERQRVAIARAMANNPEIILADEPTGNLDSKSGKDVIKILTKLNEKEGVTLVLVTHDKFIASHAKRIIKLKDGKIIGGE